MALYEKIRDGLKEKIQSGEDVYKRQAPVSWRKQRGGEDLWSIKKSMHA